MRDGSVKKNRDLPTQVHLKRKEKWLKKTRGMKIHSLHSSIPYLTNQRERAENMRSEDTHSSSYQPYNCALPAIIVFI